MSHFLYQNVIKDVQLHNSIDYNISFVETFQTFVYKQAFFMADGSQATKPFKSKALRRVIKTLFEGQAWKPSGYFTLKEIFPEELSEEEFCNYKSVTRQIIANCGPQPLSTLYSRYDDPERKPIESQKNEDAK